MGAYFQEWLNSNSLEEGDKKEGDSDFTALLRKFLLSLEFSETPLEDKPSINILPKSYHSEMDTKPNKSYMPRYSVKPYDNSADMGLLNFITGIRAIMTINNGGVGKNMPKGDFNRAPNAKIKDLKKVRVK